MRGPVPSERSVHIFSAATAFGAAIAVIYLVFAVLHLGQRATETQTDLSNANSSISQLAQANKNQDAAITTANDRLIKAGEQPVPVVRQPSINVPGVSGPRGLQGPGPSDAQVAAGAASYCSVARRCASNVPGPQGPISTSPGPKGDKGDSGKDAVDGKDGTNGVDGKDGAAGLPGRGIAAIACSALVPGLTLSIDYSDGTTQTVDCTN